MRWCSALACVPQLSFNAFRLCFARLPACLTAQTATLIDRSTIIDPPVVDARASSRAETSLTRATRLRVLNLNTSDPRVARLRAPHARAQLQCTYHASGTLQGFPESC